MLFLLSMIRPIPCRVQSPDRSSFMLLEYYEFGCLSSFLRRRRTGFGHVLDPNEEASLLCGPTIATADVGRIPARMSIDSPAAQRLRNGRLTLWDLLDFSPHVSEGMEYLISREVRHCDLAAHNILVTAAKVTKIATLA